MDTELCPVLPMFSQDEVKRIILRIYGSTLEPRYIFWQSVLQVNCIFLLPPAPKHIPQSIHIGLCLLSAHGLGLQILLKSKFILYPV